MKIEISNYTLKPNAKTFIDVTMIDGVEIEAESIQKINDLVKQLVELNVKSVDIAKK